MGAHVACNIASTFEQYRTRSRAPDLPNGKHGVWWTQPDANLNGPVYIPKVYGRA